MSRHHSAVARTHSARPASSWRSRRAGAGSRSRKAMAHATSALAHRAKAVSARSLNQATSAYTASALENTPATQAAGAGMSARPSARSARKPDSATKNTTSATPPSARCSGTAPLSQSSAESGAAAASVVASVLFIFGSRRGYYAQKKMLHQATPFLLTGTVNTAFSYGIYAACIYLGAGYAIASGVSIVGGILFSYKTTSAVVFGRGYRGSLVRYIGCYAIVYVFSVLILETMDGFGINAYLAGVLAAPPCAVLSFALLKLFVFRSESSAR